MTSSTNDDFLRGLAESSLIVKVLEVNLYRKIESGHGLAFLSKEERTEMIVVAEPKNWELN